MVSAQLIVRICYGTVANIGVIERLMCILKEIYRRLSATLQIFRSVISIMNNGHCKLHLQNNWPWLEMT